MLSAPFYRRLPEVRVTNILLEVDDAIGLLNVLLSNHGLRKMAEATTAHGFWD